MIKKLFKLTPPLDDQKVIATENLLSDIVREVNLVSADLGSVSSVTTPIFDHTVSVATTAISTFGTVTLDGAAHGGYEFEIWVYNPLGVTCTYSLFANNDQVDANYTQEYSYVLAGSNPPVGGEAANAYTFQLTTLDSGVAKGVINLSPSGLINYQWVEHRKAQKVMLQHSLFKNAAIANLTRLDLVSSVAGGIGVNSRFRLWRRI